MDDSLPRRRLLAGVTGGLAAALSGCLRFQGDDGLTGTDGQSSGGGGSSTGGDSSTDEGGGGTTDGDGGSGGDESTDGTPGTDRPDADTETARQTGTEVGTNATDADGNPILLLPDGQATVTGRSGKPSGTTVGVRIVRSGDILASQTVSITSAGSFAANFDLTGVDAGGVNVQVQREGEGLLTTLQAARIVNRRIDGRWETFRTDARNTGYTSTSSEPVESFVEQWSVDWGMPTDGSPVAADGIVYTVDRNGILRAIDSVSAEVDWEQPVGELDTAAPTIADGTVYCYARTTQELTAVAADTGETQWSTTLASESEDTRGDGSSPTVVDGTVYVGDERNGIHALDAASGETLWTTELTEPHVSTPAVADGTVIARSWASGGTSLAALDAANGEIQWESEFGAFGRAPAVVDGTVYVCRSTGVEAWDLASGEQQWAARVGSYARNPVAVAQGVVWASIASTLQGLRADDGTKLRSYDLGNSGGPPTAAGDAVYVGAGDTLHVVGAGSGEALATVSFEDGPVGEPLVVDGLVVVTTRNGEVHALDGLAE